MNKPPIITALIGISALILLLNLSQPTLINSEKELNSLIQNQKVQVSGLVIDQRDYNKITLIKLDNNLTLAYSGKYISFLNKNIEAIGIYDNFNHLKIKILKVKIKKS